MAKRRNLKKEKALRNQAYARKFRKRTSNGRYSRRRQEERQDDNNDNKEDKAGTEDGAAASAAD